MDELISRQAALRTDCFGDGHDGLRAFHMYEDYLKMRKYLESLPSAQQWIPCSERLPEEDYCTGRGIQHSESVLVTIVHHANDDDTFVDMACTVDGKWQLTYPFDDDPDIPKWCEIIAWMPLPEPYTERREE